MPEIIIHLTDKEFELVKNTMSYNGKTDLEHETFSGTEIKVGLSPFGNVLDVIGYSTCEVNDVLIEFKKGSRLTTRGGFFIFYFVLLNEFLYIYT